MDTRGRLLRLRARPTRKRASRKKHGGRSAQDDTWLSFLRIPDNRRPAIGEHCAQRDTSLSFSRALATEQLTTDNLTTGPWLPKDNYSAPYFRDLDEYVPRVTLIGWT